VKQHSALEQREASLPIRAAFNPLHFIDEPLDHPVAPSQAASVSNSLRIIVQPIDKSDQFRDPTDPDSGFPLLQSHQPLAFSEKVAKVLSQLAHDRDGLIALVSP
jgi:hypothetical protein